VQEVASDAAIDLFPLIFAPLSVLHYRRAIST
jgi:hypothetical protein